jgi:EmrB/QacA subfamily drug resistance transporter
MVETQQNSESSVNPWNIHGLTSLVMFAAFLDSSLLVIAFPSIRRSFSSVSTAELSWILNAYSIIFGALLVPSGRLADQFGRKKMFLSGVAIFTLASTLCGVAPSAGALIAARALQAVGAAMVMPTSLALVLGAFPIEKRAIAVTLWGAVGGLAAALGPSAGAFLIQSLGWRSAFYINVPIGALALLLGRKLLRESRDTAARVLPDFVGVVLLIAAVGLVTLGIVASEARGWLDLRSAGLILLGIVLSLVFVRRSLRVSSPALDLTLFSDANYRFANLATFLFSVAFFAMFLGNVLFLTQIWHYSTLRAGLAILPAPLTVIPVAILGGRIASRYGHRVLVVPGGILFGLAGIGLFLRAGSTPNYLSVWFPSSLLIGLGIGLCLPVLGSAAVHGLRASRFAVGSAVNQTARQVGGAIGVAILVALLGSGAGHPAGLHNFRHLWIYCAAMAAVAGVIATFLRPRSMIVKAPAVTAVPSAALAGAPE